MQLFLFEAQRVDHVRFLRDLGAQTADFIILDRYIDSTLAYQGYGLKLSLEVVESLNRLAAAEFWPEKTFLLDIDPHYAALRLGGRKESNAWDLEAFKFQQVVRQGFLQIAAQNPKRVYVIDALMDMGKIRKEILRELL
jgi:dTMP kinase